MFRTWGIVACLLLSQTAAAQLRQWTDASGRFSFEAELIAHDARRVVLLRDSNELALLDIDQLSREDQAYLQSQEAGEAEQRIQAASQNWTLVNGLKIEGRVVDYGRRTLTVQQRRGRVYVNDRLLSNFSQEQRAVIAQVIGHFEKRDLKDENDVRRWIGATVGGEKSFVCEGVLIELQNGDEFAVPFFLFQDEDRALLESGWKRWEAENQAREKPDRAEDPKDDPRQESLALQAAAHLRQRTAAAVNEVKRMELGLLAAAAGVTEVWEVQLLPRQGIPDYPRTVMVFARNSLEAQQTAARQFPNYTVGAAARVSRRFRR